LCRVVCVHRRRTPRRKQQSEEVRSIIDTLNVFAITEYFGLYIKFVTWKRRKRRGKPLVVCTVQVAPCDVARNICTVHTTSGSQDHHPSRNSVQKTICCSSTSNAPDDGRMYPKHVELRIRQ